MYFSVYIGISLRNIQQAVDSSESGRIGEFFYSLTFFQSCEYVIFIINNET